MKNAKSLQESQGLVDKDGIQWNDLSDLITEYVYDLQHGLNSDPFYADEDITTIGKGTIEGYYQYIHSKAMPSYIIPEWIYSFNIYIVKDKTSKGSFIKSKAQLRDNKLLFGIEISNTQNTPDSFCDTLVHEFQHAYTFWLELSKGIKSFNTAKRANMYHHAGKGFDNKRYGGNKHPMTIQKFADYLEINDEIFENPKYLERTILVGFYYSDFDEIRSFTQEFANDIMRQIRKNISGIIEEIREARQEHKNILDAISITCYDSVYYKMYKSYYTFYKKLSKMNIEDDVAVQAVKGASHAIRIKLNISPTKKITQFEGDASKILNTVAVKQLPIYEKTLKKMENIFAKLISEIPVK